MPNCCTIFEIFAFMCGCVDCVKFWMHDFVFLNNLKRVECNMLIKKHIYVRVPHKNLLWRRFAPGDRYP